MDESQYAHVLPYVANIVEFRKLTIMEQLDLVGDIVAYWGEMKVDSLDKAGKTRVDSCVEAQRYYNVEKRWDNYQMNLKKKIDLKTAEIKRGI